MFGLEGIHNDLLALEKKALVLDHLAAAGCPVGTHILENTAGSATLAKLREDGLIAFAPGDEQSLVLTERGRDFIPRLTVTIQMAQKHLVEASSIH